MQRIGWKWNGDDVVILPPGGKPAPFAMRPGVEPEAVAKAHEALDEAITVHQWLREAPGAFQRGLADYTEATVNLRHLIRELRMAAAGIRQAAGAVGTFFEPEGLQEAFGGDSERLATWAVEALERLSAPGEALEPDALAAIPPGHGPAVAQPPREG